ncbi:MAG: N-acetylmuramoyl-L-alanine amidase [Thermomicrobiales bacterium]
MYVEGVAKWSSVAGIDGALVYTQFAVEATEPGANSPGTSARWLNDRNSAGIFIPQDDTPQPFSFIDGEHAARIHVQCLYSLVTRALHPDVPLWPEADAAMRDVWLAKASDPAAPKVATLGDLNIRYRDSHGEMRATWAWDATYGDLLMGYAKRWLSWVPDYQKETPMAYVYQTVPHPDYEDNFIPKVEGVGWDNLGKRTVDGVTWHRILGGLRGTETYFSDPSVGALTDYGVGVLAQDGAGDDGTICRWNDPLGWRSGWASGPVSAPYGDGVLFVNKYGVNAVNSRRASIEISGFQDTPLSDAAKASVVAITAYWADQKQIPWDQWPIVPGDGFSFVCWHREFTIGTGKLCPFDAVIAETDGMIEDVRAILKQYQTSAAPAPAPTPIPAPTTKYATPIPPPEFTGKDALDKSQNAWVAAKHTYRTVTDAPRLRTASRTASRVGPDIAAGLTFAAPWQVHGGGFIKGDKRPANEQYATTERGTRIPLVCCEVVT